MVKQRHTLKCINVIMLITALFLSGTAYAAVTATVDRSNISVDETLNLTIEISGDDSGEPDITPLQQDFELLSQNQSSSYSLVNGSMDSKSTWFLMLRPRHPGRLIIPALNVGSKQTSAMNIQVNQAAIHQPSSSTVPAELWIDMEIEPKSVYVQQQAVITLRLYRAVQWNQAQLSEPTSDRAMIVRLGEDKAYQVNRDGRNLAVIERRYALFPMQHGTLKIESVQLDANVLAGRNYGSPFQTTRPIRVRSNALELAVEAIPAGMQTKTWLPAKHLQLIESWPEGEFTVGDSITRTLTLTAVGLNSSQLPELNGLLPDHLKAYPDKPLLTDAKEFAGVTGLRQEKLAILATRSGTFILPPIDIPWWNSETKSMQTVTLPARTFKVLPAPVDPTQISSIQSEAVTPAIKAIAKNQADQQIGTWWKWVALLSTLGWLITLIWFYRKSTRGHQATTGNSDIIANTAELKSEVLEACRENRAKACEQALISFAKAQWPDEHINNLAALAKRAEPDLKEQLKMLELHLYAAEGKQTEPSWQAAQLQTAFEQAIFSSGDDQSKPDKQVLPALYPK